jgi:PhzF family phenazine biosynthesis protein
MKIYQLDAFTDRLFAGNPAAVCPLYHWPADDRMQQIAAENNLAETAFYVAERPGHYHIRWFTPTVEVDLCGHATLATAHVVFFLEEQPDTNTIYFNSRSGELVVRQLANGMLQLDFPADPPLPAPVQPPALLAGLGLKPTAVLRGKTDFLVVYDTADQLATLRPDFRELADVPARGVCVTAPGPAPDPGNPDEKTVDFVSRFFGPQSGIDEDPVTGSAHTTLVPYWAARLGKTDLVAEQRSRRGGTLYCQLAGNRVLIAGHVRLYLTGSLLLD